MGMGMAGVFKDFDTDADTDADTDFDLDFDLDFDGVVECYFLKLNNP